MEALQTVELHRVPHSPDLEKPGDFAFIPKREPIGEITRTPVDPPTGFLKTLWWTLFGKKYIEKETTLPLWPEYDAVVLLALLPEVIIILLMLDERDCEAGNRSRLEHSELLALEAR
jgi:hypothetical protein